MEGVDFDFHSLRGKKLWSCHTKDKFIFKFLNLRILGCVSNEGPDQTKTDQQNNQIKGSDQ